jgi:FkbM family methyltransferase
VGLNDFLAKRFPFIVRAKRYAAALTDYLSPTRSSYAQAGEDAYIAQRLSEVPLKEGIYVDVGANQPTQISNSYLFYRRGLHGVAIEPDRSLEKLYRAFRPRDIFLRVGCDDRAHVASFNYASASVLSSFDDNVEHVIRREYVPALTLDQILENIPFKFIFLLSIDVEGLDVRVLRGASQALAKSLMVMVEENQPDPAVSKILSDAGFVFDKRLGCNGIYVRRDFPALPSEIAFHKDSH